MKAEDLESGLEIRPNTSLIFWSSVKIPKVIGLLSGNGIMQVVFALVLFLIFSSKQSAWLVIRSERLSASAIMHEGKMKNTMNNYETSRF